MKIKTTLEAQQAEEEIKQCYLGVIDGAIQICGTIEKLSSNLGFSRQAIRNARDRKTFSGLKKIAEEITYRLKTQIPKPEPTPAK